MSEQTTSATTKFFVHHVHEQCLKSLIGETHQETIEAHLITKYENYA